MATTYELIASQVLGSSASSVTFSSIPQTFDDLIVLGVGRCDVATTDNARVRFNGATSDTNHSARRLYGSGTAAASSADSYILASAIPGTNSTSDTFANFEIYIPAYTSAANKSLSATGVQESNVVGAYIYVVAGLWSNTSAVSQINIAPLSGSNFVTGSSFYLYAISKA